MKKNTQTAQPKIVMSPMIYKSSKITAIITGDSLSGNAGCTNGNYDIPVVVKLSTGHVITGYTCRCGCGCNGSFDLRHLYVGDNMEIVKNVNPDAEACWMTEEEIYGFLYPTHKPDTEELKPFDL